MVTSQKIRRHDGRVTPRLVKGVPMKELIEQGIEPQVYWDDWKDYRDGQRGSNDRKLLRNPYMRAAKYFNVRYWNAKIRKLIARRKLRKLRLNMALY